MENNIQQLQQKLADLLERQELFHTEIMQLKAEIENLRKMQDVSISKKEMTAVEQINVKTSVQAVKVEVKSPNEQPIEAKRSEPAALIKPGKTNVEDKSDLERFIGENLINKIGIAVTVIGVAIGAKYAIDHQLISPRTRIIFGYLVGFGLLFFAVRLKKKYENFSAVLLSGSMAIMYFVTYAAFSFYNLYPQMVAFILMVIFTVFTVTAALRYNREIIAIIGLVGACAVPFLLSEGSENVIILFSYIAIINVGILVIAVKKYWKPLYFSTFVLTWLIYFSWYFVNYKSGRDFALALIFLFVFFIIFYLTFLSYKLIRKEKFDIFDILLLLFNSFIFFGVGYSILKDHKPGESLLGLFTAGNALIHFIVSAVIYRNKLADKNLFYLVSGLVVVFITIAIPIQWNGSRVTLLWICEAALLFSIGRTRGASVYEYISYPLLLLSFLSIIQDWGNIQTDSLRNAPLHEFTPVLNIHFLTSIIFISAFTVILYLFYNKKYVAPFADDQSLKTLINYCLPALFILVAYLTFRTEISAYWNHLISVSKIDIQGDNLQIQQLSNSDLKSYKSIWLCNYTLFFFAVLSFINTKQIRGEALGIAVFWLSFFTIFTFLFQSLYLLSELRESYISQFQSAYFPKTGFNVTIRYICFIFTTLSLAATGLWIRREPVADYYKIIFILLVHLTILWISCSEMLNIMDLLKNTTSYRFGLSILTGIYALILIVLGISGKKKYLRIAAIVLLGVTLVKLFFYDITRLDTIMKTILFLALGIVMLIVSFLYNKHKKHIFGETGD
jgi:uncharacterized membrane protein